MLEKIDYNYKQYQSLNYRRGKLSHIFPWSTVMKTFSETYRCLKISYFIIHRYNFNSNLFLGDIYKFVGPALVVGPWLHSTYYRAILQHWYIGR